MPDLVPSHHAPAHSQVIFFLFSIWVIIAKKNIFKGYFEYLWW
jgi:hypothetical protein